MKNYNDTTYIERLEESIKILLKNMIYNRKNGLDNSYNYKKYEELTAEHDIYYNVY